MIVKKFFAILAVVVSTSFFSAKENLTENQKLTTLCKVWGFLKYYHPTVAKGALNWDQQLIDKIKISGKIETKEKLNSMISDWIDNLGKVGKCKSCNKENKEEYFLKNFNLKWTYDEVVFSDDVIKKLNFIEANRSNSNNHYIKIGRSLQAEMNNEKSFGSTFSTKENALLELFRYWNFVEYYFPYKYQTDQKWDEVLKEMITTFSEVKNTQQLHLAALELVTKADDSHVYFFTQELINYFGNKKLPIQTLYLENKLLITKIHPDYEATTKLKKNDIIINVNGKTPKKYFDENKKYIPASNENVKNRGFGNTGFTTRSNEDSLEIDVLRDDKIIHLVEKTYKAKDVAISPAENFQQWKKLPNEIAYVDMGILTKENVDKMFSEIKDSKAIIFDIRNYPKGTINKLANYLFPTKMDVVKFSFPDFSYPGKFIFKVTQNYGKNNPDHYKGKIIVLVNETTQSHAEYTSMILKALENTTIIGSQTAGADGNVNEFLLLDNKTRFTGLGTFYPDGTETQRIGIIPDIEVKPTITGLLAEKDEVLDRALQFIETGK